MIAEKRPSMRSAINAMCRQCIYDPIGGGGTWRQQTEACPSKDCPLYPLRPISATEKAANKPVEALEMVGEYQPTGSAQNAETGGEIEPLARGGDDEV